MSVLIKICGINSEEAAEAVLRAGADFAGLVFHPRSPRHITLETGHTLAGKMRGRLRLVALVADADDETLSAVVKTVRPDFLQLHGSETPDRVGEVRARFGVAVIKAVAISEGSDLEAVPEMAQVSDMLLFDARAPADATRPGGLGAQFDWKILRGKNFSRPWFLAGGLNEENVARAVACSGAQYVDVSSGVESTLGVKSPKLIADFVTTARNANNAKAQP